MILKKYIETYRDFSTKASDSSRTLAFAGIAIIWIFSVVDKGNASLPKDLYTPLLFFALALASDLLHYVYGTLAYFVFYRSKKTKFDQEDDVSKPKFLNLPTWTFYWAKIGFLILGYIYLLGFLYFVIRWT